MYSYIYLPFLNSYKEFVVFTTLIQQWLINSFMLFSNFFVYGSHLHLCIPFLRNPHIPGNTLHNTRKLLMDIHLPQQCYTYCLITVSSQEEFASGTFKHAKAEAFMRKSLTEILLFPCNICKDKKPCSFLNSLPKSWERGWGEEINKRPDVKRIKWYQKLVLLSFLV